MSSSSPSPSSTYSPSTGRTSPGSASSSSSTPWGERQRHTQIDAKAKGDWTEIQKKTFTRWANAHLRRRGLPEIGDLFTDTSDGIRLLQLLEVIGGDSIYSLCKRKYNPAPKFRIHKLENCNLIFEYLRKKELQLTNIGSTDIVDTNEKLILGLMWTIILRFAVAEDGKQGLLLWLQRSTEGFPGVRVANFDTSWTDGKAFLALIHKYRPDVLPYDATTVSGTDAKANVTLAFQVARDQLGIDQLLDPEDVVDTAKPDEKSMVAYLSQFFSKFASLARKQALTESIVKAIGVARKHDALIEKYEAASGALKAWLTAKTAQWQEGDSESATTADLKAKLDALQTYRREEKVAQKAQLLEVTTLLGQLRTSQRSNNRPLFFAAPGLSEKELWEKDWPALEAAEGAYEKALIEKYGRFSVIDFALTKIQNKLSKLEPWLESRCAYFESTDLGDTISAVEQRLASHEAFAGQMDVHHALLQECQRLLSGELSEEHGGVAPTKERIKAAATSFEKLLGLAGTFRKDVEARLELEKELEAAALKYSALANKVGFVLDEVDEAIAEPILGTSVEEVQALEERFEAVSESFRGIAPLVAELQTVGDVLAKHGRADRIQQERQTMAPSALLAMHKRVAGEIASRKKTLEAARQETARKVEIRQAFAEATRGLNAYVQELTEKSNLGGRRASLQPEEVKAQLHKLKEDYETTGREQMAQVEQASAAQEEAGVVANGFTTDTIYSLRKAFEELEKLLDARLEDHLSAEAALQSQTAESDEQWKEITKVFHALDEERRGNLSNKAFKEGLQALGVLLDDSEADKQFKTLCKTKPTTVTLAEFGTYVMAAMTAGSSSEDILTAFKTITGNEPTISADVLESLFLQEDFAQYMSEHMPQKGTKKVKKELEGGGEEEVEVPAYDYASFVSQLFER